MRRNTAIAAALLVTTLAVGFTAVAVADGPTVDIEANGTVEAGTAVTFSGEINGTAASGLNVTVNDASAGSTDASGEVLLTVPDVSEMTVRMSNATVSGERTFTVVNASAVGNDTTDRNLTDGNVTNGNMTDGNVTDGNATNGNVTDGNATDGNTTDAAAPGPTTGTPTDLAAFQDTRPVQATTPNSLGGKIRAESSVVSDVSIELTRNSSTAYSLAITAPDGTRNVTFYLQSQAVESSQNISNVTMYLDGERQDFYVDADAGPGASPWVLFEVDHFSTRNVTFSSPSTEESTGLTGAPGTFDTDASGRIEIGELANAATAFANGRLSVSGLSDVVRTFANA